MTHIKSGTLHIHALSSAASPPPRPLIAAQIHPMEPKKAKKRHATTSDPHIPTTTNDQGGVADGIRDDFDLSEPTMGEKLAGLSLPDDNKSKSDKEQDSAKPPSADSVHVLLTQALNADDRTLLLDCLYTRDEKVITKSVAKLSPSNVLKLLHSLISITESRGAIMVCALPWLKCLLLQHASGIMSQESSSRVLNTLYQLIESRVSTFKCAVHLSSCLDMLYTKVAEEEIDDYLAVPVVIYDDKDDTEDESEELESDQDGNDDEESDEFEEIHDSGESKDMMSE
ncbi:hypothetical protein RJT34_26815 [Clitoria ternatea]|uniref:Small-subunit processome Utp12 domain-containing protein n=1 Tax=Clitoria ternatea TaxID=43366 RepID=A0AAN9F798_CLITE